MRPCLASPGTPAGTHARTHARMALGRGGEPHAERKAAEGGQQEEGEGIGECEGGGEVVEEEESVVGGTAAVTASHHGLTHTHTGDRQAGRRAGGQAGRGRSGRTHETLMSTGIVLTRKAGQHNHRIQAPHVWSHVRAAGQIHQLPIRIPSRRLWQRREYCGSLWENGIRHNCHCHPHAPG